MKRTPKKREFTDWRTSVKLQRFIAELTKHGNVTHALKAAKASRAWIYEKRRDDQEFADAFKEAKACGLECLIDEAHRRAYEGVEEPKTVAGEEVWVTKYSDTLLMFLIKQADPTYREHFQIDHANADARPFMLQMQLHPAAVESQRQQPT